MVYSILPIISWKKISHPSEVSESWTDIVKVIVIKYNEETKRVSLGLKQLEKNPWEGFIEKFKPGMRINGTVSTVTDYGAFVEIEPDVEGLVYHTEISWNAKNVHLVSYLSLEIKLKLWFLNLIFQNIKSA